MHQPGAANSHSRTLKLADLFHSLFPGASWTLSDLFDWPPDLFAFTSAFLGGSGTHRFAVSPPFHVYWPTANWQKNSEVAAMEWLKALSTDKSLPGLLLRHKTTLENAWSSVDLRELFSGSKLEEGQPEWPVCEAFLELHAIADIACLGLGILRPPISDEVPTDYNLLANLLLATSGSLSRLPREFGLVLPKLRTPQVGLTLRSLSHHVTFHRTEVDVAWRAIPWLNKDENTVNVLIIPWPFEIRAQHFAALKHSGTSEELRSERYFQYSRPAGDLQDEILISHLISLIRKCISEASRIHVIVFPETSLSAHQLNLVREAVVQELGETQEPIPLIVAGLVDSKDENNQVNAGFRTPKHSGATLSNRISISVYNALKWYELAQDKHHRWRLDEQQIRTYNLSSSLPADKLWWEAINIPKRRLSVIASNSWLAICPLICEDLARLEPVSELLRGIGPTLLIAVLLDGPQITNRWSARYAGVLAEDPGTSVLTVTSLGMVIRSEEERMRLSLEKEQSTKPTETFAVALWNDQKYGWRPIRLRKDEHGALLSLTASWNKELSSDGRGDGGVAAVFSLQGYQCLKAEIDEAVRTRAREHIQISKDSKKTRKQAPQEVIFSKSGISNELSFQNAVAGLDMLELSIWTFIVDATIDAGPTVVERFTRWDTWQEKDEKTAPEPFRAAASIKAIIRQAAKSFPHEWLAVPNAESEKIKDGTSRLKFISNELQLALTRFRKIIRKADRISKRRAKTRGKTASNTSTENALKLPNSSDPNVVLAKETRLWKIDWWQTLADVAIEVFESRYLLGQGSIKKDPLFDRISKAMTGEKKLISTRDPIRIELSAAWAILWAIHNRLALRRRDGGLSPAEAQLLRRVESLPYSSKEPWIASIAPE